MEYLTDANNNPFLNRIKIIYAQASHQIIQLAGERDFSGGLNMIPHPHPHWKSHDKHAYWKLARRQIFDGPGTAAILQARTASAT